MLSDVFTSSLCEENQLVILTLLCSHNFVIFFKQVNMLLFDTNGFDYSDIKFEDNMTSENSLCSINYSEDYKQLHLAWLQIYNEESERALHLSKLIIEQNPSHYAVYLSRFNLVKKFKKSLYLELCFISQIIYNNLKNYQVWNYRQVIVLEIIKSLKENDGGAILQYDFDEKDEEVVSKKQLVKSELEYVHSTTDIEPKNYHAFTYLYHLLPYFDEEILHLEIQFTSEEIEKDVFNNSIWHYRLQLLKKSKNWLDTELILILESLRLSNSNESIWAHITG
eukprot:NODE_9_length_64580_cov_1.431941.p30 type:complete len:280 gc:universal NODE_9_length_64580_cov_1.431941:14776-15615(+)